MTVDKPTAPVKDHDPSRSLQLRIKEVHDELRELVKDRGNERLRELWRDWDPRLQDIIHEAKQRPEVAISLVGGMGTGKSTLLNAIIGACVLPVNAMKACTSAICEVAYSEGPYRVRVEFVSREAWQREVDQLLADFRDTSNPGGEPEGTEEATQITEAVRNKLWTVYRPSDESDPETFSVHDRHEPAEITEALDAGQMTFSTEDLDELGQIVERYLDSGHRFWPIVKSVSISGPFDSLRDGAKIIDLPGINDPNEAREQVTKGHIKNCRFVWILYHIRRGPTKDITNLMKSDDFLRQIVMDGRADALTFIGTAADDYGLLGPAVKQFKLPKTASELDVILARNEASKEQVKSLLGGLASELARAAHESSEAAAKVRQQLISSRVFTVTASEYMQLTGLDSGSPAGCTDVAQTEVPALVDHLRLLCATHGVAAHRRALENRVRGVLDEIRQEARSEQAAILSRVAINQKDRERIRKAVNAAQDSLGREVKSTKAHLIQALAADQAVLEQRLKQAADRARHGLDKTFQKWRGLPWATIKATCRKGGKHDGTSGRSDFPADLAEPILDGIAFAWLDFFGDKLTNTLEKWSGQLLLAFKDFGSELARSVRGVAGDLAEITKTLDSSLVTIERILKEILSQTRGGMDRKILETQRTLYEKVPSQIRASMRRAFDKAAQESGAGMKERMVKILTDHASSVAGVMFDHAREDILTGVRDLTAWLEKEFEKMMDAVYRSAGLAAHNLVSNPLSEDEEVLAAELSRLEEFATVVERLEGSRA